MRYANREFKIVLLISIFIHSVFLMELPRLKIVPPKKALTNLEITYQILKFEDALSKRLQQTIKKRKELDSLKQNKRLLAAKDLPNPPAFSQEEKIFSSGKVIIHKVQAPTIKEKPLMEIVKLPALKSPFEKNPAYVSYYQIIREKIKSVAYLNSILTVDGEVFLSFIVASTGQVKAIKVVEEKSVNSQNLKDIAYRFIENASPFPPFPPELKHPRLSFNVIIEFKLTD